MVAVPVVSPAGKTQQQIEAERQAMQAIARQVEENMLAYQHG
jgi:type II secretory pathway pseudopilin PulG